MKRISALLILIFFAVNIFAKTNPSKTKYTTVNLLSYDQFLELSPKARAIYIQGVRDIVLIISKSKSYKPGIYANHPEFSPKGNLYSFLFQMEKLIAEDIWTVDQVRKLWDNKYKNKAKHPYPPYCIYAGNISAYMKKAQKGGCTPPRKQKAWGAKCKKNQVLCKPELYGMGRRGKGLCAGLGGNATNWCHTNGKSPAEVAQLIIERKFRGRFNKFKARAESFCRKNGAGKYIQAILQKSECKAVLDRIELINTQLGEEAQQQVASVEGGATAVTQDVTVPLPTGVPLEVAKEVEIPKVPYDKVDKKEIVDKAAKMPDGLNCRGNISDGGATDFNTHACSMCAIDSQNKELASDNWTAFLSMQDSCPDVRKNRNKRIGKIPTLKVNEQIALEDQMERLKKFGTCKKETYFDFSGPNRPHKNLNNKLLTPSNRTQIEYFDPPSALYSQFGITGIEAKKMLCDGLLQKDWLGQFKNSLEKYRKHARGLLWGQSKRLFKEEINNGAEIDSVFAKIKKQENKFHERHKMYLSEDLMKKIINFELNSTLIYRNKIERGPSNLSQFIDCAEEALAKAQEPREQECRNEIVSDPSNIKSNTERYLSKNYPITAVIKVGGKSKCVTAIGINNNDSPTKYKIIDPSLVDGLGGEKVRYVAASNVVSMVARVCPPRVKSGMDIISDWWSGGSN